MKKTLFSLGLAALIASCGSAKTEEKMSDDMTETAVKVEKTAVKEQQEGNALTPVVDAYLAVKDALVNDNQEDAGTAGTAFASSLAELNFDSFSADQQKELKGIVEVAKNHGEHIAKSEISHQREHFEALGQDIKDLIVMMGSDRTLYHQYCPMYNGNKGGMWLSASEDILNPLYGSKMMKCGRVEEVIKL